ncbi:MAG: PadR family transcriptional regulator [Anaerolineae bacterium]|nr:PadR family transcriptional regulator [Anaerolineae bacterium]
MNGDTNRTLTTLEYAAIGLIGMQPQSGYSIINTFATGFYRWSASPGAIYPMLKRLEKHGIIAGKLEMIHETRPRKVYTLTPHGEAILDEWLRAPLERSEVAEERDVAMMKFLFAEKRLTRAEVLAWLDNYEATVESYRQMFELQRSPELSVWSLHQQLVAEASRMEVDMQRAWIQRARSLLQADQR